jgi:hypothetical protein
MEISALGGRARPPGSRMLEYERRRCLRLDPKDSDHHEDASRTRSHHGVQLRPPVQTDHQSVVFGEAGRRVRARRACVHRATREVNCRPLPASIQLVALQRRRFHANSRGRLGARRPASAVGGLADKNDFSRPQATAPVPLAMGRAEQRALITGGAKRATARGPDSGDTR